MLYEVITDVLMKIVRRIPQDISGKRDRALLLLGFAGAVVVGADEDEGEVGRRASGYAGACRWRSLSIRRLIVRIRLIMSRNATVV